MTAGVAVRGGFSPPAPAGPEARQASPPEYLGKEETGVQVGWLSGGRLHLNHGPIDLVIRAEGPGAAAAYRAALARFGGMLEALVAELPALRSGAGVPVEGDVARAMAAAVAPFRPAFITPMAAVAGAVADAVLAAMRAAGPLERSYVNNGGDIALHLGPGSRFDVAMATGGTVVLHAGDGVGGVATSGWRGRSQSLGIADAVTVLARTGAEADAAASMIANAVDLPGHPAVRRVPAVTVKADSDLGQRLVTVDVGLLTAGEVAKALARGADCARCALDRGLILGAALVLQGEMVTVGRMAVSERAGAWISA